MVGTHNEKRVFNEDGERSNDGSGKRKRVRRIYQFMDDIKINVSYCNAQNREELRKKILPTVLKGYKRSDTFIGFCVQ